MWDILEICYISFTDEILVQFIKFCKENNIKANVDEYWRFSSGVKNPNFVFLEQMVFTFLHGMMLLRRGIRYNSQKHIYAAKDKLSLLFFGRNNPNYHNMIIQERRS